MSETTARLTVRRGTPDRAFDQDYNVPYRDGMSVLDALMWIRLNTDPTLAVRYSCINANACKECSVQVDGRTTYACTARLGPGGARVEPIPTKRLVRDLVTDTLPPKEHLSALLDAKD